MRLPRPTHLILLAALALAGFGLAPGEAAARIDLGNAVSVPEPSGPCAARAAQASRQVAARGKGGAVQRRALRVQRRVRNRCLRNVRQTAVRGEATASASQVGGNLVIGIDGGWGGWSGEEIAERAELGAAVTRHEFEIAEPVDAQDDLVLKAAAQVHTRIHALLGANELGDPTHYREWVVEFIRHYGPGGGFWKEHPELDASRYAITSVELGNEPYFGGMSASLYAETVRPALEEIKRLNLPVQVVLPSRVYGNDTSWMDTLYAKIPNLNDLFYAFAEHPYWYGHDPAQASPASPFGRIETTRRRMNEHGATDKPIFITEYGESTASCGGECVSEEAQAQHLQQMLEAVVSHPEWGVKMLSVFQLIDRGTGSGDRELQFGLLRQDGSEKPSYPIVKAAIEKYRG